MHTLGKLYVNKITSKLKYTQTQTYAPPNECTDADGCMRTNGEQK